MKILVDADAAPQFVKKTVVDRAQKLNIEVMMFSNYNHQINDGYSKTFVVDTGLDSADFKLFSMLEEGDIVVTQDYGLASLCLSKNAICIHQNGFLYTRENIDRLLFERHMNKKLRENNKGNKKIKKRTQENDTSFENTFDKLLVNVNKKC